MPGGPFSTNVPARLDRLGWWRFHTLLIAALGTSWIIDGLERARVGSLASALTQPTALGLTSSQIGATAAAYVAGAVLGAMLCGDLPIIPAAGAAGAVFFLRPRWRCASGISGRIARAVAAAAARYR